MEVKSYSQGLVIIRILHDLKLVSSGMSAYKRRDMTIGQSFESHPADQFMYLLRPLTLSATPQKLQNS